MVVLNGGLWLGPELMSTVMGVASKQLLADVDPAAATRLDALTPREALDVIYALKALAEKS